MHKYAVLIVLIIGLLTGCGMTTPQETPDFPTAYTWQDYQESFEMPIRVFQYNRHKIQHVTVTVDLPASLLEGRDTLILAVDIQSMTKGGFEHFSPYIKVNESVLYRPTIPVEDTPQRQIVEMPLETQHLQPGPNTLSAGFRWDGEFGCSGVGCGYVILELDFKETS